jgi:hypothetical protein
VLRRIIGMTQSGWIWSIVLWVTVKYRLCLLFGDIDCIVRPLTLERNRLYRYLEDGPPYSDQDRCFAVRDILLDKKHNYW